MNYLAIKRAMLHALKLTGMFVVSRKLTGKGLRILAYHGVSVVDEHEFQGMLFMSEGTFRKRMQWLRRNGYPILGLGEALERLDAGTLPQCATVLTIDDGWHGTYRYGLEVLAEVEVPATIYITTYYAEKQTKVFNVVVRYAFWKSTASSIDLAVLSDELSGAHDLHDSRQRETAIVTLCDFGNTRLDARQREDLAHRLCQILGVDDSEWDRIGGFRLMSAEEIRDARRRGFDIQLHTHRHAIATNATTDIEQEIEDNRDALARFGVAGDLLHFCYPSGQHSKDLWPVLNGCGIRSATLCEAGFNYPTTGKYELRRFLDAEYFRPIEFEAEMSGVLELFRHLRSALRELSPRLARRA